MRGKISAVNSIFIGSSNEIGEFESGIAAKIFGTVPAVYFGGVHQTVRDAILNSTGFTKGDFPFRYLGMPRHSHG